ncbi:hypothetical protein AAG570_000893 [Ranatra chinensis]|uniref:Hyccin n=1 Tax=Ranatra chinensis TaxID=642074 RepID=A0ABD0Z8U4_9HEMI
MTEHIIQEWLADYAALSPDEIHSFADTIHHNRDVINAVYAIIEDRQKYNSLIEPVCTTLFGFYRSKEVELQRFTLLFLPTLIYVYLNAVAYGERKSCRGVEALLVGLYNLEAVDDNGQAQNISFRLPSLAQASIYHEPMSLAPASLTESALRRLEECNTKLVRWGPLPQLEKILAQNRLTVMTALFFIYNRHISSLQKHSLDQLCKVSSRLVTQGFNKPEKRVSLGSDIYREEPRIPVTQQFLLEILHSLYYSIFNGDSALALQAVEEVHQRACFQVFTDVLLVTNAIKNSTLRAHPGQSNDAPMGISMAISPLATPSVVSKSMITNASFRTKKLPDDIPIQIGRAEGETGGLGSISEEKEEGGGGGGAAVGGMGDSSSRRSLPKMAVTLGKKTRERLSKSGRGPRLVNGAGQGGDPPPPPDTAEDTTDTDSAVIVITGADNNSTEITHLRKSSNSNVHNSDSARTMQVSSV